MCVDPLVEACKPDLLPRKRLSFSSNVVPGIVAFMDSAVILLAAIGSFYALVGDRYEEGSYYAAAIGFVWLVNVSLLNFAGLYQLEPIMRPLTYFDKIVIASATTFLFLLAAAFSLKISTTFSRVWIASFAVSACVLTIAFRVVASRIVGHLADRRVFTRNVVVAGAFEQTTRLLAHIEQTQPRFITLAGVFTDADRAPPAIQGAPTLGRLDGLERYIRTHSVDDVIIALPWSADDRIMQVVTKLRELPVNVYLASDLIGFRLPCRQPPDHFGDTPLVEVMGRPLAGWGGVRKALLDYGVGALLTLMLLPLMAVIALAIKLDSKGPVFFRQERYGFVNKVFRIWKFRTMTATEAAPARNIQATRNDPRVTRVGRFLRRWSLDELPQLFNVLNGTMSLVGPRPHAIDHNEEYSQLIRGYFARHRVKPGITGWAQVNGLRGETKRVDQMEARVKYDIYYTENWTLLFDLKILLMTIAATLQGKNAY